MDNINNNKLQKLMDFFDYEEGWDRKELIDDIIYEIEELKGNHADEIGLEWNEEYLMTLDNFINVFYVKMIQKVCNVIKSFQ